MFAIISLMQFVDRASTITNARRLWIDAIYEVYRFLHTIPTSSVPYAVYLSIYMYMYAEVVGIYRVRFVVCWI